MDLETKRVYRVCKKREIRKVLRNSFSNLGEKYFNNKKKHMHFFTTKNDALRVSNTNNRFLCTYDISTTILDGGRFVSEYVDRYGYHKLEPVEEFAIKSKCLNKDNIFAIEEMDSELSQNGYTTDKSIDECVKVLYKKKK